MNGSPTNFSKNEKAFEPMAEVQLLKDDDQLVVEERCSALWNEIKDAGVLDGAELSNAFLAQLQSESDQLDEQVQKLAQKSETLAANAQLRLCSVWTALEELKRKKQRIAGEMGDFHHHRPQIGTLRLINSFRKWLKQKEAQHSQVKQRIAHSHDSESSLRELEQEQLALQKNIETEGRTKHQQLCNNSSRSRKTQNKQPKDVDKVISDECAQLEQRYLALWLASLESLELIHHFSARFLKNCSEELLDSELEALAEEQPKDEEKEEEKEKEGPKAKRRKTNEEEKGGGGEEMEQYEQNNSNGTKTEAAKCHQKDDQPQHQLTDIGYSSGENTSVHEGGTNTTVSEEMAEEEAEGGGGKAGENDGEGVGVRDEFMLVDNSELEKSFYRTVPLDEFGQTDLDTDEGNWPRSTYWAQRFMEEVEKTGTGKDRGTTDLTDSLIVHVDGPESRERLNDFEGFGLADGRRFVDPFIEDECESQSTDEWNDGVRTRRSHPSSSTTTRKRTLTRTLLLPTIWTDRTVPVGKAKSRQSPRGTRRKCAAVRKTRSSTEGLRERATNWTWWPNLSSDFEWDDEGYRRTSRDEEISTEKGGDEEAIAIARKKALRSFRDSLFKAATQSGHVNVRLQELLVLVDKSLGGVDSASFLLVELNNTFTALSNLCRKLEQKMGRESGEKKVQEMDILKEDMEAELLLCHERMNALETTCNNLALLLGGHLGGSESNKNCALKENEKGDYLAQFANECSRIRKELQKLKKRFDRKVVFCCLNKVPFVEDKENSGGKWKNRTAESADQIVECAIQSSALTSVRPVPSPFWRSYLLLCLFGLIASFGALLFATSRDGTDWRWTFGPQLNYERGAPPF